MPSHRRNADFATDEVADVRHAVDQVMREMEDAELDGEITPEELRRIREALQRADHEAAQAEVASEWTSVGELWAMSALTGGPNTHLAERAQEIVTPTAAVGLELPRTTLVEFPPMFADAFDAAAG